MSPDEEKELKEKDIERVEEEFDKEEERLKNFKSHKSGVGVDEMRDISDNHPLLLLFFEFAEDVLDLTKEKRFRLIELENDYTMGLLSSKYGDFREFKRDYVRPFYKEFFNTAEEVLRLNGDRLEKFRALEQSYASGAIDKDETEDLQNLLLLFAQKKARANFWQKIWKKIKLPFTGRIKT